MTMAAAGYAVVLGCKIENFDSTFPNGLRNVSIAPYSNVARQAMTSRPPIAASVSRRSLVNLGAGLGLFAAAGQSEAVGADNIGLDSRVMVPMPAHSNLPTHL